jgi:hypothetical protein
VGVTPDPFVPSPKSHEYDAFATVELEALKNTVSPTLGSVGEKTKFADPAGSVVVTVIWRDDVAVNVGSVLTRSVTVNDPPRV